MLSKLSYAWKFNRHEGSSWLIGMKYGVRTLHGQYLSQNNINLVPCCCCPKLAEEWAGRAACACTAAPCPIPVNLFQVYWSVVTEAQNRIGSYRWQSLGRFSCIDEGRMGPWCLSDRGQ